LPVADGAEGAAQARSEPPHLLITGIALSRMDGHVFALCAATPIISQH